MYMGYHIQERVASEMRESRGRPTRSVCTISIHVNHTNTRFIHIFIYILSNSHVSGISDTSESGEWDGRKASEICYVC